MAKAMNYEEASKIAKSKIKAAEGRDIRLTFDTSEAEMAIGLPMDRNAMTAFAKRSAETAAINFSHDEATRIIDEETGGNFDGSEAEYDEYAIDVDIVQQNKNVPEAQAATDEFMKTGALDDKAGIYIGGVYLVLDSDDVSIDANDTGFDLGKAKKISVTHDLDGFSIGIADLSDQDREWIVSAAEMQRDGCLHANVVYGEKDMKGPAADRSQLSHNANVINGFKADLENDTEDTAENQGQQSFDNNGLG